MGTYRHHRSSIFWPLTLISIGALFLYHNFNPAVRPWHLIAKYWPAIIIVWGVSKATAYFQDKSRPEVAPRSLFSAGEIVLLIFVLVAGTALSKLLLRPWTDWPSIIGITNQQFAEMFFNSYTFTQRISQNVEGSPHILIANLRGNVDIGSSDQQDMGVLLQKTVWAENESAARRIADQLTFHFTEKAGQYELVSSQNSIPYDGRTVRLDMSFRLPKSASAQVTNNNGDISISGLKGNQTLTSGRGDVRVSNIEGLVRIHQTRGDTSIRDIRGNVEIEGRGGNINASTVTGSVTVEGDYSGDALFENIRQTVRYNSSRTSLTVQNLPGRLLMDMGNLTANGVDGPFELVTRDKDINLANFKSNVKITNSNGNARLQTAIPPTRPIDVTLKKGDITLSLPAESSFTINAASTNGEVSSNFPGLKITHLPGTPGITGSHGKGGPNINLLSSYGTIRVVKSKPAEIFPPGTTPDTWTHHHQVQSSEVLPSNPCVSSRADLANEISVLCQRVSNTYCAKLESVSKNFGNETWTQSLSSITVFPSASKPAIAKAMAIR